MFLAPWFLIGLLAAAVPVVIHLRRSRRMERIVFSTNRFFDETFVRASKQAKLRDRLMMFLRMLLLMLFVLALAQPLLHLPQFAGLSGSGRVVAIVIDDSASMNRVTSQGSNLEQAKAAALSILDELSPSQGDRATIILAGWSEDGPQNSQAQLPENSDPSKASSASQDENTASLHNRILFAKPSSDLAALREAVRSIKPTDLGTDLTGAVKTASKIITPLAGSVWNKSREVFVISDLQPGALAGQGSLDPGKGTGLYLISLAPSVKNKQADCWIDALQYDAPQPMLNVPFTFRAMVTNAATTSVPARVNLIVNDEVVAYKTLTLEPSRSQVVRIEYRFTKPGWHAGRVQIITTNDNGPDPLPADNKRYFALNVLPGLKILAINGSPSQVAAQDELFFLRLALTASSQSTSAADHTPAGSDNQRVELTQITAEQLADQKAYALFKDYPVVVLANVASLSPHALEALEKHVDQGAGLLITLGNKTTAETYNSWSSSARTHHGLLPATLGKISDQPAMIDFIAPNHPATAGFSLQRFGDLSLAHYQKMFTLNAMDSAEVLLKTDDNQPLLLERGFGKGRVMMYASTIDRDWNDQPLQPAFVPLVLRLMSHLAQGGLSHAGFFRTGQAIQLPASVTQNSLKMVERPDHSISYLHASNRPATPASSTASANYWFTDAVQAGIYQVKSDENSPPSLLFAANIPANESAVSPVTKSSIQSYIAKDVPWVYIDSPAHMADAARLARQGTGLWQQMLILALILAVCEPWLANRWTRWRSSASQSAASSTQANPLASNPTSSGFTSDALTTGGKP